MNLCVVGLGKLGAVMAAVFAEKGCQVIGVDVNPELVRAVNEGRAPVEETGLDELVRKNRERLSATLDCAAAVRASEATFLIVPTPSGEDGAFSLRHVMPAIEVIGAVLREKTDFHVVVVSATVMPGATGGQVLPALERISGKKCGQDFGLCYNPEFIALGSVIHDMLHPDMVLIGESDARSGHILEQLYARVCENQPRFERMNFVNAELTKISVNTFVTTKISYANMLGEICDHLPGADVDAITAALGADTRIGGKYLKGALGYGGPCFPRDNIAFAAMARRLGVEATLAEATDRLNRRQVRRLGELIEARLGAGGTAAILGLSYKPQTSVVEESQGVAVARWLRERGVPVMVYDPVAMTAARARLDGEVRFAASAAECARAADVVVITTPWDEFRGLRPEDLRRDRGRATVIDCWRILPREEFEPVVDYVTPGTGPEAALEAEAL
jgi:UDPglucose 6-dehydrogenase